MLDLADLQTKTDAILATVTTSSTSLATISTLVAGLKQQIADLQVNGTDPTAMQALSDTVDKIGAAADANAATEAAIVG